MADGKYLGHCEGPRPAVTSVNSVRVINGTTSTSVSVASTSTAAGPAASSLAPTGAADVVNVGYAAWAGVLGAFGWLVL